MVREFLRRLKTAPNESPNRKKVKVKVNVYQGSNPHVLEMMEFLSGHLSEDLLGAYVHGSLGTYEEINYSDFDALVILKNEVLQDASRLAKAARRLINARKIMLRMDPLQHHSWFVLTQSDLSDYPQTFFPHELFTYAKSLLPDRGGELEIAFDPGIQDYYQPFKNLLRSIRDKLDLKRPRNLYQLKGLLSQVMLLPALYCQARDRKGIFKKYSFQEARKNFTAREWEVLDEISSIRQTWHVHLSLMVKFILTRSTVFSRLFAVHFGPSIPRDLAQQLDDVFYNRVDSLISLFIHKLFKPLEQELHRE
ncbi:MAG: hypothetical protein GTO45_36625 [Candidatus Aminicenantes bacterium]|nr:hypothetical protein [Candidatus Aminicenantes bacterium]NIM84228.1 hypothetical protein [Candidatus Aminicenantes bacterium]NIN90312.1 hypothetical protein [Candidatus Aminicenantes bacterium]NIO86975.1 hypothetical protein [Candidatus Aminicenantes bacterium]NIQ72815.1 hypothetical protein [Candidatus Aminicenantes bacterium]